MSVFRTLLINNAQSGFRAFSTFSGAQVGDTVKLNDGMATSNLAWSAYPSDTAITGNFTQTATVTKVNANSIECDKPIQDNKTITITTDENADIEIIDNTTIQTVSITSDQTANIETSTSVTTENNGVTQVGTYHIFNLTVPPSLTAILQSGGIEYTSNWPNAFKANTGVGLLLKNGNNVYYRNSWGMTKDYELHYQQINFTYPEGATVTCKVNNVAQSNLTPYVYMGDIVEWSCDNAGTVTTGTYTVPFTMADGLVRTITIS